MLNLPKKVRLLAHLSTAAKPKTWDQIQSNWGNFIQQKTIPNTLRWNSAFQHYRECRNTGSDFSPLDFCLCFFSLWQMRWEKTEEEGGCFEAEMRRRMEKRDSLAWCNACQCVCVRRAAQVSGFYLSEGKHWGMHTSGQMQILRPGCKSYRVLQSTCVYVSDRDKGRCSASLRLRMWEYFIVRSKTKERETNPPMV